VTVLRLYHVMKNRFEVGVVLVVRIAACMCLSSLKVPELNMIEESVFQWICFVMLTTKQKRIM